MKSFGRRTVSLLLLVSFLVTTQAENSNPSTDKLVFDKVDTNHDGAIDRNEFSIIEQTSPSSNLLKENIFHRPGFLPAFVNGITMIIATELGDKTFWLAALMSMRYSRVAVFGGSIGALIVMTILSVGIGVAVPALLPKQYTHYAAAGLFAYFGIRLLHEAYNMDPTQTNEELVEAEEQLADKGFVVKEEKDEPESSSISSSLQGGATAPRMNENINGNSNNGSKNTIANTFTSLITKDWVILTQAFTITFLAEWGDRSQIATIAMAAAQDPFGVGFGGIIGHSLCTGLAVVGGRLLSARISERMVAYMGGALFIIFSLHSVIMGPDVDE
jgi:putative Ca2+/H+ antiporter (TMEM165/GDT1 family)